MPMTPYAKNHILDEIFNAGGGTFPSADLYIQLHSGWPGVAQTSNVIAVGRQQVAFGSSSGGSLSNTDIENWTIPTTTCIAWSAWDAAGSGSPPTGGNAWWWGWIGDITGVVIHFEETSSDDLYVPNHGLIADDRIAFEPYGGQSLPGGISEGTLYYVLATGLAEDSFRIAQTSGGSAIDITTDGQGIWRRVYPKTGNSGETARLAAGSLVITL